MILHGGTAGEREGAAIELARRLLCERAPDERPCGVCRHCVRIVAGGGSGDEEAFHPDFAWLLRDLKTSTSAEATRDFLRAAQLTPFEARGQVFVVAEADTLTAEASDSLLKAIEEPGLKAPRHFLFLAPSRIDLPPTLRSRSLSVFLGSIGRPDGAEIGTAARELRTTAARAAAARSGEGALLRLDIAHRLAAAGDFDDPRAAAPWTHAAAIVLEAAAPADGEELPAGLARRLLELAEALGTAAPLRLRGIPAERILEGLVARHLA